MRLPRPHVPLSVECDVARRQARDLGMLTLATIPDKPLKIRLTFLLERVAKALGCEPADLHLDHDLALVNREKLIELPDGKTVMQVVVPKGGKVLRYFPDANDPNHLLYRVGGAGGDHDVKTRVRGEHGQHSDLALARKNRRIEERISGEQKPSGRKIQSRGFAKVHRPMRRTP